MRALINLTLIATAALTASCWHDHYGYHYHLDNRIDKILARYCNEAAQIKFENDSYKKDIGKIDKLKSTKAQWWKDLIKKPFRNATQDPVYLSLEDALLSAITHSTQLQVISDIPIMRQTSVNEAIGRFDPVAFLETKFDYHDEPVGSTLTVGGDGTRLREDEYSLSGGIRKRLMTGTEFEIQQMLGRTNSNSTFFTPNPQGKAELKLRITQPLLRGNGFAYNTSAIRIAEIDTAVSQHEFIHQTENHLIEVTRAYWNLYSLRGTYFQKLNLAQETAAVLEELTSRSSLDTNSTQVLRVKSALAQRKADLVRAEVAIMNAQDRLSALTNDPKLTLCCNFEIIPTDTPAANGVDVDLMEVATNALNNRDEIEEGFLLLQSALIRAQMSKNELLPTLNMFLEGRLRGLSGKDNRIANSFTREFDTGGPGAAIGLLFEYPLGNHAAEARNLRRKIEIRQQVYQIMTTIETILLEVKVSVRETMTAAKDLIAKHEVLLAAQEDVTALEDRLDLDTEGKSIEMSSYLEMLIDAQERLAKAENALVDAQAIYSLSLVNLQKAQGNLLVYNKIKSVVKEENGLPRIDLTMHKHSSM